MRKRKRLSDETPGPEEGQKDSGDKVFRKTLFFSLPWTTLSVIWTHASEQLQVL